MTDELVTDSELLAYADEQLSASRLAEIEAALRKSASLRQRLADLLAQQDSGQLSLGEVWRRQRLSCPTREQLEQLRDGTLEPDLANYIRFHMETVGCRYCEANWKDLLAVHAAPQQTVVRRRKLFESSAGFLPRSND